MTRDDLVERLLLGAGVGLWTAAPDLTTGPTGRRALRAAVLVGGSATCALTARRDAPQPAAGPPRPPAGAVGLAGALALIVGANRAGAALERRVAAALRGRGVRRPYLWLGALFGLLQVVSATQAPETPEAGIDDEG